MKIHFNTIHSTLGLPCCLFPSGLPTKSLYVPFQLPIRPTYPADLILLDLITRLIFGEEYRALSSSLCKSSPLPCYLVLLSPERLSQHPILEHLQPMFLPQCERTQPYNHTNQAKLQFRISWFWIANWETKYFASNGSKHSLTSFCC